MAEQLPGTTVAAELTRPDAAEALLSPLFLAGGLTLSQVAQLTGLEPHMIQNWVRRGFVSPPQRKRYSRRQFSRIVLINMLRGCMQLDKICSLLSYVNGDLDDESDDLIDDWQLYCYAVRLIGQAQGHPLADRETLRRWCAAALEGYTEPRPGAGARVERCLCILLTAWTAGRLKQEADALLSELE